MTRAPSAPPGDGDILAILRETKTIAVIGLSADPPSSLERGFRLPPRARLRLRRGQSRPWRTRIHGAPVFESLAAVDRPIDMVDIFRAVAAVGGIVDAALMLTPRPKVIWMQLGLVEEAAAARARAAGLAVVMNRCPKIEIARFVARA